MSQELNNTSSLEDVNAKVEEGLKEIESLIPEDPISKATGAKVGSEEHTQQGELLSKVKETNSTKRVNRILTILEWVGYIGLAVSSVIKLTGIIYDINYHVPFLKEVIGNIGLYILGFFITVIIVIMTHLTSDGLVNNKWKAISRLILVWLAMLGLTASFYFDYRAITNYTTLVVEKQKEKKIANKNDTDGVAVKAVNDGVALLKDSLAMYTKNIKDGQARLLEISSQKNAINDSIDRVKKQKEKIKSRKTIKKLNQNIYTSRKQLESLVTEETSVQARQKMYMEEIGKVQEKIEAKSLQKGELLEGLDDKMDEEQFSRMLFLFVLVIFIEFTSFGKLLADFLGNKNLEADLKAKLDQLNNNTNTMDVLRGHLNASEVQQARNFDRELTMRASISEVHALSSIATMHRQAQNVKSLTQATHKIGEATQEVTNMAIEGVASSIQANLANRRVKKLEEFVTQTGKVLPIVHKSFSKEEEETFIKAVAEDCLQKQSSADMDLEKDYEARNALAKVVNTLAISSHEAYRRLSKYMELEDPNE